LPVERQLFRIATSLVAIAVCAGLAARSAARLRALPEETVPERYVAWGRKRSRLGAAALSVVLVVGQWQALWLLPVWFVAMSFSTYRVGRDLFSETWSFGRYLLFRLGCFVALYVFRLLLLLGPVVVALAGVSRFGTAIFLGVVLVVFAQNATDLFLSVVGAQELEGPAAPLLEEVVSRSSHPMPRLLVSTPRGGRFANAFALPEPRRPAVVFGGTLVAALSSEELAAIFAHEMAHLETFRARMRRRQVSFLLLAVGATVVPAMVADRLPGAAVPYAIAWVLGTVVALSRYAKRRRAQELDCDRRAVALCGNPEALVNALEKLHALALLPSRFDPRIEPKMSHPSLERRIAAIREGAARELEGSRAAS
jgi:heat shock protein HtpX